jgi:hypothetical protein
MKKVTPHWARVTLDGWNEQGISFAAYVEETWNGWSCPWFTEAEARRVCAEVRKWDSSYDGDQIGMKYDPDKPRSERFTVIYTDDGDVKLYPCAVRHDVGGEALYDVGGADWTWFETQPSGLLFLESQAGACDEVIEAAEHSGAPLLPREELLLNCLTTLREHVRNYVTESATAAPSRDMALIEALRENIMLLEKALREHAGKLGTLANDCERDIQNAQCVLKLRTGNTERNGK